MGFAKNRLASSQTSNRAPRTPHRGQNRPECRPGPWANPAYQNTVVVPRPAAALPAPFSYTHRPGRSGSHGPAGSGVDFPVPRISFVWVLLKIGSRAHRRAIAHPEPHGHGPWTGCLRRRASPPDRPTLYPNAPALDRSRHPPRAPAGLPYTARPPRAPASLPYTTQPAHPRPPSHRTSQPAYPIPPPDHASQLAYPAPPSHPHSRPAYPIPHRPPHLPADLPYTAPLAHLPASLASHEAYPRPHPPT